MRTFEVLEAARRSQIDLEARTWTVFPHQLKGGTKVHKKPHVVPLSDALMELLERIPVIEGVGCSRVWRVVSPSHCRPSPC